MENFIVSARKYRPQTFDTVVGQEHVTTTLKNALHHHQVAQAFLFCGPRGVGKTTCARILAKTINCFQVSKKTEPCDQCESCQSFNSGHSLNIYELDAASNNSVDDIRNLVNQVSFAPQIGTHKVYIIDEVHMLSQSAFNAFLKTLEEPPRHAIFILATTEKHKIIPTILSRCQIFDFRRIRVEDAARHLQLVAGKEKVTAEEDALHLIAQKADGSLRDALSIFDQMVCLSAGKITYTLVIDTLSILDYDYYFKTTDALLEKNTAQSLLLLDELLSKGFDGHNFLNGLAEHFRNLLVCKDAVTLPLLEVSHRVRERYKTQSAAADSSFLLNGLDILSKADIHYKASRNQRLLVELALVQICSFPLAASAAQVFLPQIAKPAVKNYSSAPGSPELVSEPPAEKKAPASSSEKKSFLKKIPSISSFTGETEKKKNDLSIHPEIIPTESKNSGISSEMLEKAWVEFSEIIRNKKKFNLYSTLTANKPFLENEITVCFPVMNPVQEDEILTEKTNLLLFLRNYMNNNLLQLKINVVKEKKPKRKPYTGEEKFEYLAGKNPALKKLKQKLHLEIDF